MSALPFELRVSCPQGSLLVGGHSPAPDGISLKHAQLPDGRPYIPASALRGAIRETFEATLRGAGHRICLGGSGAEGADAPEEGAPATETRCALGPDGALCLACRLFGSARSRIEEGERGFAGVLLFDALPDHERERRFTTVHGVALDRRTRSASDGLLFSQLHPEPGDRDHLVFLAPGRLLAPELKPYLDAATRLTTHIGHGKSRGLGRVDVQVIWKESATPAVRPIEATEINIEVELIAPAAIGTAFTQENVRATRFEIPGSALRGAVGFALAETLPDLADADFQQLVDETGGAHFGFLHPCTDPKTPIRGPWPLTAVACKVADAHPVGDELFDRLAGVLVDDNAPRAAKLAKELEARACRSCGSGLARRKGWRGSRQHLGTRLVTRVALDRPTRSAQDGALFSAETIPQGARFVGSIRAIPPAGRAHLAQALESELSFGGGRSLGWGRVKVVLHPAASPSALATRQESFAAALQKRLKELAISDQRAERLIPLTLTSPLVSADADDGSDALRTALEAAGLKLSAPVLAIRRFDVENGWDQRKGPGAFIRTTRAGSVFVFALPEGATMADALPALQALEDQGAGHRRHQGYGQVIAFDPAHVNPEAQIAPQVGKENQMREPPEVRDVRRNLVMAAEKTMARAFGKDTPPLARDRLSKTQLSNLVGVTGAATCHEEVVNYLHYQVGRREGGWPLPLAEAVIADLQTAFKTAQDAGGGLGIHAQVQAWQRYTTYLSRAFRYRLAVDEASSKSSSGNRGAGQGKGR